MYGMDDVHSSLLYGYPVCMCCWLRDGDDRRALHAELTKVPPLTTPIGTMRETAARIESEVSIYDEIIGRNRLDRPGAFR